MTMLWEALPSPCCYGVFQKTFFVVVCICADCRSCTGSWAFGINLYLSMKLQLAAAAEPRLYLCPRNLAILELMEFSPLKQSALCHSTTLWYL